MMEITLREAVEYMNNGVEIIVETEDGKKFIPNDSKAYFQLKDIASAKFFKHLSEDMNFPERFEFHDWYLEKYGKEYPYTYSQIYNILADRENPQEKDVLQMLTNQFNNDNAHGGEFQ